MIRLEGVTKVYPDGTKAVDGISFEVPEGDLCVLVGPSGCGKTTTMKMINRLIPLTKGKIYLGDDDIAQLDVTELRRKIGYVIQEIGLFPHMTVRQNVETVPALLGWPKQKRLNRVRELLDLMSMEPDQYMDSYPAELSGGQRQRVGVARAMGADPRYMLMDEPFGAIDPITRERLQDEFLNIQAKIKKTIIFVTHDINEAIKMGDHIALLKRGKLIQFADPSTLLAQPKNDFVSSFVGEDRTLKRLRLLQVGAIPHELFEREPTCALKDSISSVQKEMQSLDRSFMPVIDEKRRIQGWLNLQDVNEHSVNGKTVEEVYTKNHHAVSVDTPLHEALSAMLNLDSGHLPVVDNDNVYLGLLTFEAIQHVVSPENGEHHKRNGTQQRVKQGINR